MAPKALGYNMYAGADIDIGDLKYIAEANVILSEYEEIFIDGEVMEGVGVSGKNSSARIKKLNYHVLILIADYSTYMPVESMVKVTIPNHLPEKYTDIETGEELFVNRAEGQLIVRIYAQRMRLLYGGPSWRQ